MPYPNHWLFVMGGHFTNTSPEEIWECTVRGTPSAAGSFNYGDEEAALAALQGPMATWFHDANSLMRTDADLRYLKLNEIGPDGKYVDAGTSHTYDYATPTAGQAGSTMPTMITAAWSWTTARSRGIGAHGRIYPPVAVPPSNDDRLSAAEVTAYVNAAKALLSVLDNPGTSGVYVLQPAVVSRGAHGGTGAGMIAEITGVRVGNVIDLQRRRKSALPEVYTASAWP